MFAIIRSGREGQNPEPENDGIALTCVNPDNGREFCGTERHPCELYLARNDIEQRKTAATRIAVAMQTLR